MNHRKIITYVTAEGASPGDLDREVKKHLESGLQPYGPPSAVPGDSFSHIGRRFFQAMVRYEPDTTMSTGPK